MDEPQEYPSFSDLDLYKREDSFQAIVYRLDPDDVIAQIEHYLLGERFEPERQAYVQYSRPLATKEGVTAIVMELKARLNKNVVQSNLDEKTINQIMLETTLTIIDLISNKYKEWEISPHDWDRILYDIEHQTLAFLRRALNDGERKNLSGAYKYVDHRINQISEQKNQGFRIFK